MHYYLPDNEKLQHPLVSPGFATENEFGLLPPTLIQIGDAEKLRDEAIVFSRTFKHSPVHVEMYEDMIHVFHMVICFVFI
jgi:acetyl esterase/lipase